MEQSLKSDARYIVLQCRLKFTPYDFRIPFYYLPNFAKRMGFVREITEVEAEAVREEVLKFMQIKKGDHKYCYDAWMSEVFKMNGLSFSTMNLLVDGTEQAEKTNALILAIRRAQPVWLFACFLAPLNHTQMFSTNAEENFGKSKIYTGA